MQDPAFAAALRLCGERPVVLPSGLVLLKRRLAGVRVLMLPRAYPPDDLSHQLALAGLARLPLLLSPEAPCPMPRALPITGQRKMLQIDLCPPETVLRATLHQKWRNQLRRAEQSYLRVRQSRLPPDHPLLALAAKQAKARGYQNWPSALTAAFAQTAPPQTSLFTAHLRGHPVAHMLFLLHGTRATYHIGHTSDAGRNACAHNLLLWGAMRHLSRHGITLLDLGPLTTPAIDRFKRRAGARVVPTGGTWLRWSPLARVRPT
ncbi:GNAT family N-acetyltransferase [Sulfitobacter sp. F26169L]|uniref:GNAT family N-acetyltransferase n=1 Tax=Sulfitobacter sp. F26169L TaxID=2996015 RepID=UPI0022609CC2|nr:GNAT family N-acetyltransferase [Sulfitobacter sp. F26169L]